MIRSTPVRLATVRRRARRLSIALPIAAVVALVALPTAASAGIGPAAPPVVTVVATPDRVETAHPSPVPLTATVPVPADAGARPTGTVTFLATLFQNQFPSPAPVSVGVAELLPDGTASITIP